MSHNLLVDWVAPFLIVVLASAVQGAAGFAFGILSMALLTLIWEPQSAGVVVGLLVLYSLAHPLWNVRHGIRWNRMGGLVFGTAIGLPIGTYALVSPGGQQFLRYLVAGVCLLAAAQNWKPSPRIETGKSGHVAGALAGIASGFLSASVNSGGPPILWYIYRRPWTRDELMATTLSMFFLNSVMKLVIWGGHDLTTSGPVLFTRHRLLCAVALLPAAAIGSFVGVAVFRRTNREQLRHIVCALLVVMACVILVTMFFRGA